MIAHELAPDIFEEVLGDLKVGENIIPYANFFIWSDDELAAHDCYRVELPATPAGKLRTKYNFARVDGVVQAVCEYEDAPPTIPPPPPRIPKLLLIDRLIAAGKLEVAYAGLGGPGQPLYERWQASQTVDPMNHDVRALLSAIGCDIDAMLAPE
jgi:hypothetical protein